MIEGTVHDLLVVSVSGRIARPIEVVRRHFGDVDHHARNRVHPDVDFTPLAETDGECRFRKTLHIAGIPVSDEVILRRQPDGSITEDSVAGPSAGMRFTTRFRAEGPEVTATTLTVELPLRGVKRFAAGVLRRLFQRRLLQALEEDRRDLEDGTYARPDRP